MKYSCLILIIVLLSACRNKHKDPGTDPTPARAKHYEMAVVREGSISSSLSLPCQLLPYELVQLYPKVNGFVKEVLVDRGSVVHKGEVLVRLDAPEVEQQYLAAHSKYLQQVALLEASKDTYERLVATSRIPGTVSAHDLAMAHAKMIADSSLAEGERSNFKALSAMMDYLVLRAPFDGVITERNVHPGALVGANMKSDDKPMLILQQESRLRLVIDIPEEYSGQIGKGQPVQFSVNAIPGQVFKGSISRSAGVLGNKFRAETVEVDVMNTGHLLKPGMYAEARLPVAGNRAAMVVPRSAIVTSTEKKYVVVADGHNAKWVDVLEGNSVHDSSEVFGALHPGDKVILRATDELKRGAIIW